MILPLPPNTSAPSAPAAPGAAGEAAVDSRGEALAPSRSDGSAEASPFARLLEALAVQGEAPAPERPGAESLPPDIAKGLATEALDEELPVLPGAGLAPPVEVPPETPRSLGDEVLGDVPSAEIAAEALGDRIALAEAPPALEAAGTDAPAATDPGDARDANVEASPRAEREVASPLPASSPLPSAVAAELEAPLAASPPLSVAANQLATSLRSRSPGSPNSTDAPRANPREIRARRDGVEFAAPLAPLGSEPTAAAPASLDVERAPEDVDLARSLSRASSQGGGAASDRSDAFDPLARLEGQQPSAPVARPELPGTLAAVPVADPTAGLAPNALAVPPGVVAPAALSTVEMAASLTANPVPPSQAAAVEAISQRVEMLASQGGGVARIRLNPPELGQVELSVRVHGNSVDVTLRVEEVAVQAAAHGARDRLVENLSARDLQMENFEISSLDSRSSGNQARDGAASMNQGRDPARNGGNGMSRNSGGDAETEVAAELRRVATSSVQVVDIRV